MFIHFPCPALFPHLPQAVSWAGDAFVSTLPSPLTPPPGSVPWQWGEHTSDKHHISGKAVCAHVWLPHRKKRKRKMKKREEESLSCIKPWKRPHPWEQMAFQLTPWPRPPSCAQQSPGARLVLLCKEERENQITETST